MFEWDDLKIFLAAARSGSLTGAAQKLMIDTATVGRRLSRLESALKATLFTRSPGGLRLTATGARLLEAAHDVEAVMERAHRAIEYDQVGGTVRLSVAEGFGTVLVAPALPRLRAARPQLRIELAAQSGFLSASKREADIAVTLAAPTSSRIVVETLTDYTLGLFASPTYLKKASVPKDIAALRGHDIVGYVDDLIYAPELRYLDEIMPDLRPALSSSSIRAQREILLSDGGIGVLPHFMSQGLRPVLKQEILLTRRFWLSTHRDVVDTARARIVCEWLRRLVQTHGSKLIHSRA